MLDEQIVGLVFNQDSRGIKELKNKYGDIILNMIKSILKDEKDIEKCITLTYDKLSYLIPIKIPKHLEGFVLKYARETAIIIYKETKTEPLNALDYDIETEFDMNDTVFYDNLVAMINTFAEKIPSRDLIIFLRYYFFNNDYETIAEILDDKPEKIKEKVDSITKVFKKISKGMGYDEEE